MESLTIKLETEMAKAMEDAMRPLYSTKTEFVREALRKHIEEIQKEKALADFLKLKGSSKRRTSDAELRRVREEVSEEYMKKYGLK